MGNRVRLIAGGVIVVAVVIGVWVWLSSGHESTDDAQIEGHVTQVAPRVGGTVLRVAVNDNQQVEPGAVLVEIDPRDYQIALEKAKAELTDAGHRGRGAEQRADASATATGNIGTAQGSVEQARGAAEASQRK